MARASGQAWPAPIIGPSDGERSPLIARRHARLTRVGLVAVALLVLLWTYHTALPKLAWPDEFIYLVGARKLVERGTLQTNFYLAHSILLLGYPHRDVHMPGYVFSLAPFVAALGGTLAAATALNALAFLASILLGHALARSLLGAERPAAVAAGLFALLPPFPAYLRIAYPEWAVTLVFLAGLAWLFLGRGAAHAAVAGALFAVGALFRESLLLAFPLYLVRIERRPLLRGFLPAFLATLALVVAPFARGRAVHPNALYPAILETSLRSASPVTALGGALAANVERNLALLAQARPAENPEDAALAFLALLAVAAAFGSRHLPPEGRRFASAVFVSLGLLVLATFAFYVVRLRGGVWGGVRAFMPWAPVLLVLATPLLFRPRRAALTAALVLASGLAFLALDRQEIRFFNRYKSSDLEDQERRADYLGKYIDAQHPRRVLTRNFFYGFTRYPVEVIWSPPADPRELAKLESAIDYDFVALPWQSPLRLAFIQNPRYLRVNKPDRDAELLIWRRLF